MTITVGYLQTSRKTDTGKTLKPWPVLVDHYKDIIDEITKWIDSNLNKPLKIEDVAARAGYSKWHLQRIFLQVKEVSLGKYIRDTKLRLAAKDLTGTNEAVMVIALKYGFDSQQTFTRVFSKKYKLPPLRYRNTEKRKKY
ncbi:helix-turn-helix domain-containing protein [Klebsiella grimontii]|uniref:helix-turn-helix domain-containing protein n=1 Tax=Klebsiella grimontii TaxID=2058152 RepID=UPI0025A28605|nr:helix-turn-helix domain-containing protein [Klebsiella grimontii]MDM7221395.1 helix-turn-helix domain-containing protein [Klebsiella grimontii]